MFKKSPVISPLPIVTMVKIGRIYVVIQQCWPFSKEALQCKILGKNNNMSVDHVLRPEITS